MLMTRKLLKLWHRNRNNSNNKKTAKTSTDLRAFYVPGIVLNALYVLTHSNHTENLCFKCFIHVNSSKLYNKSMW